MLVMGSRNFTLVTGPVGWRRVRPCHRFAFFGRILFLSSLMCQVPSGASAPNFSCVSSFSSMGAGQTCRARAFSDYPSTTVLLPQPGVASLLQA